ncbi:MAG: diaminopimelate dehydrogenase [Lachnospiraceae bacterium]|nr:diaminopimelate dehydrogenase [Lachnospiraceae bacterium]
MMTKIGILGYGNLGRGVEKAVNANPDQELVAVFTRRDPKSLSINTPSAKVLGIDELDNMKDDIDVLVICGGSATDLPVQTPKYASEYNVVDSFDTHANIPVHFEKVDKSAKEGGKVAVISAGWDPGMFSLARCYSHAILESGVDYTFWGKGVSQGHSDAIRRIEGVADARQYTVPVPAALEAVRSGANPTLSTREKHTRECFVVAKEGADKAKIEQEIKTMPNYFADYDTMVTFISQEELDRDHKGLPHGGSVIYSGSTDSDTNHVIEFSLKLDSNPEFTGAVLSACARAAHRMQSEGMTGAKTMLDIPPAYLSHQSGAELRAHLL